VLGIALESAGAGEAFDITAAQAAVHATLSSTLETTSATTRPRRHRP